MCSSDLKKGLKRGGNCTHCKRRANLAAEVPCTSMPIRNNCYRYGSLCARSDRALHGILVRESGALMGAASYAGMGHFPAHRFTSATITLFVLTADK